MKRILALGVMLFCSQAMAESADYVCSIQQYRIDLNIAENPTSSHFWLTNTMTNQTLSQAYAGSVESKNEVVLYRFYPATGEADLWFRSSDVDARADQMVGQISTMADGFLLSGKINCRKLIN